MTVSTSSTKQLFKNNSTIFNSFSGLAGFARLTPGDVFQVIVNHGPQKWKSKGHIRVKAQHWDNDYSTFKALIGDILNIKVTKYKVMIIKYKIISHKLTVFDNRHYYWLQYGFEAIKNTHLFIYQCQFLFYHIHISSYSSYRRWK